MAIAVAMYGQRELTPPRYLNRVELWRYNGNTTGDGSGGNIDFSFYLPSGFNSSELNKLFPNGLHFNLESLFFGSNIAASQLLTIVTSCLSDFEVTGVSGTGYIQGMYLSASADAVAYPQFHQYFHFPVYLGKRRQWNTDTATIVLRTANTNLKKFDLTAWMSVWDGMPKDVFKP